MKTIAVFFDKPLGDDYPLNIQMYVDAYRELSDKVKANGGRLCIVRSMDTFLGGNTFSKYWEYEDGKIVERNETLTADVIYNKAHFEPDDASVLVNSVAFDDVCTDKMKSYDMFAELFPQTALLNSADDIDAAIASMRTETVVSKPVDGEGGSGVIVKPKNEIKAVIPSFPYLLQEFIDMNAGIPGFIDGLHDFRMICINEDIKLCYIRTPPSGEFTANVSRGGKEIEIPLDQIPAEALALHTAIDEKLKPFGRRIYSIDLGRDASGRWFIIELNSKPGLEPSRTGKEYGPYLEALAANLCS